ncbi:DUF4406 domain-containing protein [Sutcliffiella rhizosphaerae]|uniref:Uncharacterized protein n=1 Tax=Sutcliffiella rhizosphaerae TaxID=2880967 RepID=A0ABM8YR52_9BACI|nr:DUF4406 domain-containing protein [Sutcliffiella rhizosphaerae]CAG9622477.1 hypothetical protein BACCIP111883_03268 [Sutcliffiella rhizosphaerae]
MKVITLCGSTKFKKEFRMAEATLTLQGNIVLSLGFFEQSEGITITQEQVKLFKEMHYKKIDMADEIFVVDEKGYIGESTASEIEYARKNGKPIRYWSEEKEVIEENCPLV